ncbi:YgaB family protein [Geobacillus sp. 46C-IIa]|uniref:YgaB family protein n=1 Tax=Geobacillus sp. 46C-IIa TaxID=1963025 RepID=UPI001CC1E826|nr:YgaB family protein [Geobacillus sp. 46C-IIa]
MEQVWVDDWEEALFLWNEMERCQEIARQLQELEREAPTPALREEVRQMKQQVEAIRRVFERQVSSSA